jgi:hypothetical protein
MAARTDLHKSDMQEWSEDIEMSDNFITPQQR